jgi:hypothetical protein
MDNFLYQKKVYYNQAPHNQILLHYASLPINDIKLNRTDLSFQRLNLICLIVPVWMGPRVNVKKA